MKPVDSLNNNKNFKPVPPIVRSHAHPPTVEKVNLLKQTSSSRKILKKILGIIIVVILLLAGVVISKALNISGKIFVGSKTTFLERIETILTGGNNIRLVGENLGQINILLLGIGGEGHDGPYLTDTMIVAEIRPDINQATLVSIPRDYWAQMPNSSEYAKINAAFSNGYLKSHDWNEGGSYARQAAEQVSGLNIPYFAVMDFSGFEKAIEQVGGVDVTVDRTFTDYAYPDSGTGYLPPQTFTVGPQHMDGQRALIFARSRHAAGIEGSDFARSQRQQKIINAFKQKTLGLNLISDVSTINSLLNIVADHFHTNISPDELYRIYNLVKQDHINTFTSLSLDPSTGLICPEIAAADGAYILTPCPDKSTQDVQNFFKNSFSIGKLADEKSTVWLASSTGDKAAYDTAFRELTDAGIQVYQLDYSKDDLSQTIVYQVNPKPATTEFIKNDLGATEATVPPPGVTPNKNKVDVIVVLGSDFVAKPAPSLYVAPPARVPSSTTVTAVATSTPATTTVPTELP